MKNVKNNTFRATFAKHEVVRSRGGKNGKGFETK